MTDIATAAYRVSGFIIQNCKSFNIELLKSLYTSLVRSKLEYACPVWSPHNSCHKITLEKVQRKFVKFLYFKKYGYYPARGFDHDQLLYNFQLDLLEVRRNKAAISFMTGVANGWVDCNYLLSRLNFRVPRINARTRATFYISSSRLEAHKHAPIKRMCQEVNKASATLDIFFNGTAA